MNSQSRKAEGVLECAVFVVAWALIAEITLRAIPVVGGITAHSIGTLRLAIYVIGSFGLGFWMHRRYSLHISRAALGMGAGVLASFALRIVREQAEGFVQTEDSGFLLGLAAVNWAILLGGAALSRWTKKPWSSAPGV